MWMNPFIRGAIQYNFFQLKCVIHNRNVCKRRPFKVLLRCVESLWSPCWFSLCFQSLTLCPLWQSWRKARPKQFSQYSQWSKRVHGDACHEKTRLWKRTKRGKEIETLCVVVSMCVYICACTSICVYVCEKETDRKGKTFEHEKNLERNLWLHSLKHIFSFPCSPSVGSQLYSFNFKTSTIF